MAEKQSIYCGNGKALPNNGFKFSVCIEDIPPEYHKVGRNGKIYVNVVAWPRQQQDQFGNTHSVKVDTYEKS